MSLEDIQEEIDTLIFFLTEDEEERQSAAYELSEIHDPRILEPLAKALQHPNRDVRCLAAWTIYDSQLDTNSIIDALLNAVNDEYSEVRGNVLLALGMGNNQHDARIYPVLAQALSDESDRVRSAAAFALSYDDDLGTYPALIKALNDPSNHVLYSVVKALGNIGNKDALPYLVALQKTLPKYDPEDANDISKIWERELRKSLAVAIDKLIKPDK